MAASRALDDIMVLAVKISTATKRAKSVGRSVDRIQTTFHWILAEIILQI